MEIIAGVQEYDVAANWKLMVENSVDDYHLPSTHSTWLNFMANSGVKIEPPKEEGLVLPTRGKAVELGNGHFTTDNINFRGRPVAKWIPLYGEAAKAEIDAIRAELVARLGAERAPRVADTNRNLVIFPNLVINDGSSVTVRTFYPEGVGKMHVTAWALGPVEEGDSARARRLDAFLTFYGPGGFATPDDVEALELVQQGLANWAEDRWSEMSRGMGKEGEQLNSDEHHLRIFWRRWNELMGARAMTVAAPKRGHPRRGRGFPLPRGRAARRLEARRVAGAAHRRRRLLRSAQRPARRRSSQHAVPRRRRPRAHPPAHHPRARSQLPRGVSALAHCGA